MSNIADFVRLRKLERAVYRVAVECGIERPNLHACHDRATHNCLNPIGRKIYFALPSDVTAGGLRTIARRMCESAARGAMV